MGGVIITNLGKMLRIIRIRHDITQQEMAEALGVTGSFLSAVERGKRTAPMDWYDELIQAYNLSEPEETQLRIFFLQSAGVKVTAMQFRKMMRTIGLQLTTEELHVETNRMITAGPDEEMEALCKIMAAEKCEGGYRLTAGGIDFIANALGAEITGK